MQNYMKLTVQVDKGFLQGTPIQRSVVNAFIDSFFKWLKSSEYNAFLLRVKYGPLK